MSKGIRQRESATSVAVELYLREGMTGTAWFHDITVVEEYPPALDCVLLRPSYRGRLAVGARDQRVLVRASVGHGLKDSALPRASRSTTSSWGRHNGNSERSLRHPTRDGI